MSAFNTPRDWFLQFMAGGVAASVDLGITDDRTIVDEYCGPLRASELSQLLQGIEDVLHASPFPWKELSQYRFFRDSKEAHSWLLRIRDLVETYHASNP